MQSIFIPFSITKNAKMTPFGQYLEQIRRDRRLSQKQLAYALDINPSYVSALETGKKSPPTEVILQKLISSLSLDKQEQDTLWDVVELSQTTRKIPNSVTCDELVFIRQLWQHLGTLSPEQLAIMNNTLKLSKYIHK